MMVQALLPGCSTMQEATNQSEARRSKEPPVMSDAQPPIRGSCIADSSAHSSGMHALAASHRLATCPSGHAGRLNDHPSDHMPMLRLHEVKHPFGWFDTASSVLSSHEACLEADVHTRASSPEAMRPTSQSLT